MAALSNASFHWPAVGLLEPMNRKELKKTIEVALAQSAFVCTKNQFEELTFRIQQTLKQNTHSPNTSAEHTFQEGIKYYLQYGALNEPLRAESIARGGNLVELCVMEHVLNEIKKEEWAVEFHKQIASEELVSAEVPAEDVAGEIECFCTPQLL